MQIYSLSRKKNTPISHNGFSLMELLVVLVIIGLLAALVGPNLFRQTKAAKRSAAKAQIENFITALDTFFIDVGRYPSNSEGLSALRSSVNTGNWQGPYLKKEIPSDPWGNAYFYRTPGRNGGFEIVSFAADGVEGGEGEAADIRSWE